MLLLFMRMEEDQVQSILLMYIAPEKRLSLQTAQCLILVIELVQDVPSIVMLE